MVFSVCVLVVIVLAIGLVYCYTSWSEAERDRVYNYGGWRAAVGNLGRTQEKLDLEVQQHKATRTTAIERQRVLDRNLEHATARAAAAEAQLAEAMRVQIGTHEGMVELGHEVGRLKAELAADTGLLEREQTALRDSLAEVSAQNIRANLRNDMVEKHAEAILRLVQLPDPPPAPQTHTDEPRLYAEGETQLTLLPPTEPAGDGELRNAA